MGTAVQDRFWAKVAFSQAGCWEWIGAKTGTGYGNFKAYGRYWPSHRFAYTELVGPLPSHDPRGYELDHLCRNRSCVRPAHLELVLHRQNVLRGVGLSAMHAKKTHCPQGHPLSGDNLQVYLGRTRLCRACRKVQGNAGSIKRRIVHKEEVLAYQRAWYAKNGRKKSA